MNKYGKLIRNAIIFGLGSLSVKVVQFLVMPILTAHLTVDEYGINEILANIMDLGIPILTLGMADSLFRFSVGKDKDQSEVFSNGIMTMISCISVVVIAVPTVYYFIRETYVILMLPLLILYALKRLVAEFTRGRGKVVVFSIGGILESLCVLISAVVYLIVFELGITGYVLVLITGNLCALIYYTIVANPFKFLNFRVIDRKKLKAMIKFSAPNVPNMISWWIVQTSSKYILIGFSGLSVASLYMAASKIPALINIVSTIFFQAWSLSSSEECGEEDRDEFYSMIFRYYSFVVFLAVSVIVALTPYVSKILLQGEFYVAWTYSPVLILAGGLGCIAAFYAGFYAAFYRTNVEMWTTFIGGGVNLALCLILIPFISVYGAMIGNLVGFGVIVISRIITTRKYVHIKANWCKFICVFVMLIGQAVLYTVDWKYAYVYSIVLIAVIMLLYLREIIDGIKGLKQLIARFRKPKVATEAVGVDNESTDTSSDNTQDNVDIVRDESMSDEIFVKDDERITNEDKVADDNDKLVDDNLDVSDNSQLADETFDKDDKDNLEENRDKGNADNEISKGDE